MSKRVTREERMESARLLAEFKKEIGNTLDHSWWLQKGAFQRWLAKREQDAADQSEHEQRLARLSGERIIATQEATT